MKEENELITPAEELKQYIRDGFYFNFCVGYALNIGFKDAISKRIVVEFNVGDYEVKFVPESFCFTINHKVYFARMIMAGYTEIHFTGEDENEIKQSLLEEFEKELELINQP